MAKIETRDELNRYIECDLKAIGRYPLSFSQKMGGIISCTKMENAD